MFFNPLHPKSDKHLISPNSITPELNIKVTEIKEMITNWRSSWLLNKFSLPLVRSTVGVLRPLKLLCTWSIPITGIYGVKLAAYTYIYMNVLKHAIFQLNRQVNLFIYYTSYYAIQIHWAATLPSRSWLKSRLNKQKYDFSFGTAKNSGLPGSVNEKIHLLYAWLTGKSSCPVGWDKCFC